jgi:NTP pyrophosphatase (non-canonical NTP hydrolase)
MKRSVYMAHVNPAGFVFVKTLEFFQSQRGFEEDWGKAWVPVVATCIEDARREGCRLPGARPYKNWGGWGIVEESRSGKAAPSLNELRDEALRIAVEHGFAEASIGEDLMLIVSELAEALEDVRAGKLPHETTYECADSVRLGKPCGVPSEMADVIIRVLHFCGKHGIDIEKAVKEKMEYNESRPFRHGGKKL